MTEIEKLLDEANDEVIVLFNENNEEVAFEQIADRFFILYDQNFCHIFILL